MLSDCHILVVEDEALIALELVTILEDQDAKVIGPVRTVIAALRLLATTPIDCALLDIKLIDENAFAVAYALSNRHVPFAFLTAYDDNVVPFRYGGRPTIHKPVTVVSIVQAVNALVPLWDPAGSEPLSRI
jgi:DNA-binding response OmpR family regulator